MDRVERMARDNVNKKEAELEEKFMEAVAEMKDLMSKTTGDIVNERNKANEKIDKMFGALKNSSIEFFE
jgi:hypothetical protein